MLATDESVPVLDYKPFEDIAQESEFAEAHLSADGIKPHVDRLDPDSSQLTAPQINQAIRQP
jgi:hypothetical protein